MCRGISVHWSWPSYDTHHAEPSLRRERSPPWPTVTLLGQATLQQGTFREAAKTGYALPLKQ